MLRTAGRAATRTAVWLSLAVALGLLLAMVVVPRIGGAAGFTILTGSMQPNLPPGTFVAVRPTPFEGIDAGEVVTYQLRSGQRAVVTHRVIGRTIDADGRPALITQGDANNAPDPEVVIQPQVRGVLWYSAPFIGRLNIAAASERAIAKQVVAVGLLVYAGGLVLLALRRRTRPATQKMESA